MSCTSKDWLGQLWRHECERVYSDRLLSDAEVKAFDDVMVDAFKKNLGLDVSSAVACRTSYCCEPLEHAVVYTIVRLGLLTLFVLLLLFHPATGILIEDEFRLEVREFCHLLRQFLGQQLTRCLLLAGRTADIDTAMHQFYCRQPARIASGRGWYIKAALPHAQLGFKFISVEVVVQVT